FYKNIIVNESAPIYKIINSYESTIYSAESRITKFGFKDTLTKIEINNLQESKVSFKNYFDKEIIEFQLYDSKSKIRYKFIKSNILSKIFSSN